MSAVTVLCAPRDEAFANQIADALARRGHTPRRPAGAFHEGELAPGDDAAIVVWSNAALRIARLHQQARAALERGTLIPVAVGGALPPGEFEALPPVDLSGWVGDEDDPRWRFVLEEIEIASARQRQMASAPPPEEAASVDANGCAHEEGEHAPPIAAPAKRRARRRSRFNPYIVVLACGAALAALTGAAVFLIPAPGSEPAADRTASAVGALDFVQPVPPTEDGAGEDAAGVEETSSGYELTVTREPDDAAPDDLDAAAAETLAAGIPGGGESGAADPRPDEPAARSTATGEADAAGQTGAVDTMLNADEAGFVTPDFETGTQSQPAEPADAAPDSAAMDRLVAEVSDDDAPVEPQGDGEGYFRDCDACPQMARIPAGRFTMGAPEAEPARQASEGPLREVAIAQDFALSAREITFAEWDACVAGGGCREYAPYDQGWGRGARPAVNVSFEDAQNYVRWLSEKTGETYRLPSEAEWEYAARAGTTGPFAFEGTLTPEKANYDSQYPYVGDPAEARGQTTPTASFAPNAFGLYDMHGNVWEWTADCWAAALAGAPADGAPRGGTCARRVLKGGAWNTGGWRLRSAHRIGKDQTAREFDNGFRVVRELD